MAVYLGSTKVGTTIPISGLVLNESLALPPYPYTWKSEATSISSLINNLFRGYTGLFSIEAKIATSLSLDFAFSGCTKLESAYFNSVSTASSFYFEQTFSGCSKLVLVDLSGLTTLTGEGVFYQTFRNCTSLKNLAFPSLLNITPSTSGGAKGIFQSMLGGVTGCTVHFPSNLQSVIGSWSDVTAGFGGTNTTVLFDLPATT